MTHATLHDSVRRSRMILRPAALLGAIALLAGCVQAPLTRPVAGPVSTAQLLNDDPTSQCLRFLNNDPRLQVLVPRVGSVRSAGYASVPMLSSRLLPTAEEKTALEWWGSERQRCLVLGQAYRSATLPAWLIAGIEGNQKNLVLLTTRLYSGQITYGQFNTERQDMGQVLRQQQVDFEQQRAAYLAQFASPRGGVQAGAPVTGEAAQ